MPNQENGNVRQLRIRIPMSLYRQLEKDAEKHCEETSTRARHILADALMDVDVSSAEEREIIKKMVADNWDKIKGKSAKKER